MHGSTTSAVAQMSARIVQTRICRAKFWHCAAAPAGRALDQIRTLCSAKVIPIARFRNSATTVRATAAASASFAPT
eukprot:4484132-Pyramimonas_sp.AAC.1